MSKRDVPTFCGCCGRAATGEWCNPCRAHVLPSLGRAPHERTYLAQFGVECPRQIHDHDDAIVRRR